MSIKDKGEQFSVTVEMTLNQDLINGRRSSYGNSRAGYRSQFYYDGHDWDASFFFPTDDWILPGETTKAEVFFLSPSEHVKKLHPGKEFFIREGFKIIGSGHVLSVRAPRP